MTSRTSESRWRRLFAARFGHQPTHLVHAPGRVNLIGEHIDYAGLPVLPMAIDRGITLHVRFRTDDRVRIANADASLGAREFTIARSIAPYPAGDWGNYVKAAVQGLVAADLAPAGFDTLVSSDLPPAAGLASSSALVVASAMAALATLSTAGRGAALGTLELAELLARAEQYVGARGGGMDQAVILGGRAGHAADVRFDPLRVSHVPVPGEWSFVVAHSLTEAAKAGEARDVYNTRRAQVERALDELGESDGGYPALLADRDPEDLVGTARDILSPALFRRFRHVVTEADRVARAEGAMRAGNTATFGRLMRASHDSLRVDFEVSTPPLDTLVEAAHAAGAVGARLTGAGMGGCIVALVPSAGLDAFLRRLHAEVYAPRGLPPLGDHLFAVRPSGGAAVTALR